MAKVVKMMRRQKSKSAEQGLTLIEVIVAMAVLSLVVAAFTQLMGWSFTNIFYQGEKSKAIAAGTEKIEQLGHIINTSAAPEDGLQNDNEWVAQYENLFDKNLPKERRFYYEKVNYSLNETPVNGYKVTVVVFYEDFKFYVLFEDFINKKEQQ
ncbi:MAG: prepilin-type N-terminal cleavage/methylation domain-containing protein [Firmicutes bacterium]|nr:prepilin-type N-terminal cleavage/methylation domain-containing protein [Bacillota bacterium]